MKNERAGAGESPLEGWPLILGYLGVILMLIGGVILLPLVVLAAYPEEAGEAKYFVLPGTAAILMGYILGLHLRGREHGRLHKHQDTVIVVGAWALAILLCAAPFVLTGRYNFTQAVFECTSGWSTTGLSVVDVTQTPHIFLLYRSVMLFFGGVGLVLVMLCVLSDSCGMRLYSAEGHPDRLLPNLAASARTILAIYAGYILAGTALYMVFGMDWFDALNHSFSTVATGGFSTKNNSIAAYPQASIQWILIFFMFIAGINFSLHAQALRGVVKVYLRDRECRFYTVLLILGSAVIVAGLVEHGLFGMRSFPEFEAVTRAAVFQLVSVCTTTGFVSENFNLWPSITLVIILMFMLMGGCAGSTGGGVKVMRLVMLFRLAYLEIFRLLHPHSVRHLKIAGKSVPVEVISGVVGFFLLYLIVTTVGTIVLTVQDMDLVSAFTATLTCISNVGPGLGSVGPVDNFSHVPTLSKWVLTLCMLLGRLEIYAILVLFIPEFWRD